MPGLRGSFLDASNQSKQQALSAYSQQSPDRKTEPPGKTAGGLVSSGAGMAVAGYSLGSSMAAGTEVGASVGGGYGAAIGAGVGILSYLLS